MNAPHTIRRPDIATVHAGEKFSHACGAEARHQARAEHDGIAVNGVLLTIEEYAEPLRALGIQILAAPSPEVTKGEHGINQPNCLWCLRQLPKHSHGAFCTPECAVAHERYRAEP